MTYNSTLDDKSRINIPVKLREELGESFHVTKTLGQPCLTIYTNDKWEALIERIGSLSFKKAQTMERFLIGNSCIVEPDKQGRMLIPSSLRKDAGLENEIVIIGMSKQAEIWSKKDYDKYDSEVDMAELMAIADEF